MFAEEMEDDTKAAVTDLIHVARVSLVEHNILEALVKSLSDQEGAITELNKQMNICTQVKDAEGSPCCNHLSISIPRSGAPQPGSSKGCSLSSE